MKILVLNGSPRGNGNTKAYAEAFKTGAEKKGHEVKIVDVGRMKINACLACEYCHEKEKGVCVQKDAMQDVYPDLAEAEMIVFASPVHYFGLSGQMQSALSRFYAPFKPAKADKYGLILSSGSPDVYAGIESQYKTMVGFFGAQDCGIYKYHGEENGTEKALAEIEAFGASI